MLVSRDAGLQYKTLENFQPLYVFQNVLRAVCLEQEGSAKNISNLQVDGYFSAPSALSECDGIVANHCLNEMEPWALKCYLAWSRAPLIGIGMGGKRVFNKTLAQQHVELLELMWSAGRVLVCNLGLTPIERLSERKIFAFVDKQDVVGIRVNDGSSSVVVGIEDYKNFVGRFTAGLDISAILKQGELDLGEFWNNVNGPQHDAVESVEQVVGSYAPTREEAFINWIGLKR